MQKARDHFILLGQAIFVLCVVLILANFRPVQREYSFVPVKGERGEPGIVDYDRVASIIDGEVAALPKPEDGQNGKDGKDGADGIVDYSVVEEIATQAVQDYLDSLNNPPVNELEVEYRDNPNNGNREWRLVGDDTWLACLPEDNCL